MILFYVEKSKAISGFILEVASFFAKTLGEGSEKHE